MLDIYAEMEPDMSVSDQLNKEKWPYTYMAVSYPHLMEAIYRHGGNMSVYESKYSQWIEKLRDDRRDSMTFQTTAIEINGEKPVSYTHLDVYKRKR